MAPFIVPRETLAQCLKTYRGAAYATGGVLGMVDVPITVDDPMSTLPMVTLGGLNGATFAARAVDGTFPDWRRVMPTELGEYEFASLDAQYVLDACDAIMAFRNRKTTKAGFPAPWTRGDKPSIISDGEGGVVAVVMPRRDGPTQQTMQSALDWSRATY